MTYIVERVHSTENGHVDYKKILAEIWKYSELCMLSYSQASQKFIATSHTLWRWVIPIFCTEQVVQFPSL